jgi:hypothetical protein
MDENSVCQVKTLGLLGANKLSGVVARNLSGFSEARGGPDETDGVTIKDSDEVRRGVCRMAGTATDAGGGGMVVGRPLADVQAIQRPL